MDTIRGADGQMLYRQRRLSTPHYHLACRAIASEVRRWTERVAA